MMISGGEMDQKTDHAEIEVDGLRRRTLMLQGVENYKEKRYPEALSAYEEAIQLDSNNSGAYVGKGDCLRQLGNYRLAILAYEQAISIDPSNSSAYVGSGYTLLELGEYSRASLAYVQAIRLNPKNASAYNVAGQTLYSQRRFREALQAFDDAIRLAQEDNNIAGFHNNRGKALLELERYQEALDAFVLALQFKPGNTKYQENILSIPKYERFNKANEYCDKADELSPQQRIEEALQFIAKGFQVDPDHIRAAIGKGFSLLNCCRYEAALGKFDQLLQLYPKHLQALLGKGKALYSLKHYNEALIAFNQALLLDSRSESANVGKGHTYLALNRTIDALKCFGDGILLQTKDVSCYVTVGYLLWEFQFFEAVISTYEMAFQRIPDLASRYLTNDALSTLMVFWPYLAACMEILREDAASVALYLSVRDTLTICGLQEAAAEAQQKAVTRALATIGKPDNDQLWSLICYETSNQPANVQFELLQRYVLNASVVPQQRDTFERISSLYPKLFENSDIPTSRKKSE